jgi:hypothetical protein
MKQKFSPLSEVAILLLLGLCGALVHTLLNGQYGFHRDELDIIMNARQLAWGYVAYPPITPFIARIELMLFGSSLQGMRLFSALSQGVVIFLGGMMARDMGGKRGAQVVAAIAIGIAPVALMAGTLIQYMAFDFLWWVVIAFFFVRLLATEDPRYWLGIGAGIGLGMMTKFTIAFWVVGLVAGVLLSSRRKDLLSRWLWLGVLVALIIYLPNLIWQVRHEFISLDFLQAIHARDLRIGRGDDFLVAQLYSSTNPFTLPLWFAGVAACLFSASMKRFRPVVWMFLTTFLIFLIARGRSYYIAPGYGMLIAAGSVWIEGWLDTRSESLKRAGTVAFFSYLAVGSAAAIIMVKPVAPINSGLWRITSQLNPEIVEMVGWQDLTAQVASIYQTIPEADKPHTAILAGNYGEAGAFDLYGRDYSLPPVISGADNFWYRGYGNPPPETLIIAGFDRPEVDYYFRSCINEGKVTNRFDVPNEETSRDSSLYVCRQPRQPWAEMWQEMQWFQ